MCQRLVLTTTTARPNGCSFGDTLALSRSRCLGLWTAWILRPGLPPRSRCLFYGECLVTHPMRARAVTFVLACATSAADSAKPPPVPHRAPGSVSPTHGMSDPSKFTVIATCHGASHLTGSEFGTGGRVRPHRMSRVITTRIQYARATSCGRGLGSFVGSSSAKRGEGV